jgi:hypothetical protein
MFTLDNVAAEIRLIEARGPGPNAGCFLAVRDE